MSARRRRDQGACAYQSGKAAEEIVAREYRQRGHCIVEQRWRGAGGEIDLILRDGEVFVFCEVKAAASFTAALSRLSRAQAGRIHAASSEYLEHTPLGQLSDVRFDLAVVDRQGRCEIMENAFGHF